VTPMHPFRRPIAWFQAHPFAADVLLAAAVTALTLPSLWSTPSDAGDTSFRDPDVLGAALLILSSAPIAWRRRAPFPTLVVVGTAAVAYEAFGYPTQFSTVGVLIALYTAAAHLDRRRSLQAAAFTAVGLAVVLLTARWEVTIGSIASNIVIFATVWLIGDNLQTRRPTWPPSASGPSGPSRRGPPRPSGPWPRSGRASHARCTTSWPTA
jgi:hypothetical protein